MSDLLLMAADLVAITLLTTSYFRRHGRRDMLLAYVGLNVGVLAVTTVLVDSAVAAGLGLGLFGVLSIIRLRSSEISQEEVAYYFAALALGLLFGLSPSPAWLAPALAGLVVGGVAVVDHLPRRARSRRQVVTLDRVLTDEARLVAHLEGLLGGRVRSLTVQGTDLVRDSMVVDVRYVLPAPGAAGPAGACAGAVRAAGAPRTAGAVGGATRPDDAAGETAWPPATPTTPRELAARSAR